MNRKEAAIAVAYAHTQEVLHTDLKPKNIFLDVAGHARVTDFAITTEAGTATPKDHSILSRTILIRGTREHSYLRESGRAQYVTITDEEAMEGFKLLSLQEGIIPALESAHAIAHVMKMAPSMKKDEIILVCLSGRGDKDVNEVADRMGVSL